MTSKSFRVLSRRCLLLGMVLLQACVSGPPPSPIELGEVALSEGDWRSAKTHFAEALRIDSSLGQAWLGQARAQLMARDPEHSLKSLSSLSKTDRVLFLGEGRGPYTDALEGAAKSRLDRKRSEAALVAARVLSKVDPNRRGLSSLLGRALIGEADRMKWQGEREHALALYREACVVVPGALEAWIGAAELLIESGQGREAMRLLAAARKRHPTAGAIRTLTIQALSHR